jgi:hypothetical protein
MPYKDDSELPEITDEALKSALQGVRPYTIVILRAGPNFSGPGPDRDAGVAGIIWEHGKRNFALRTAGVMPIVLPVADGSGVCGVSVFDASPEEAEQMMSTDPGVKRQVFTYEIHPARGFPGSCLPHAAPAAAPSGG